VPEVLEEHLTTTVDGLWVVWAYKLARQVGDLFMPLTGSSGYPADAKATCKRASARRGHDAPDPRCTCGFHAVSSRRLPGLPVGHGFSALTVALSGRVLAFDWIGGGVLWRAERQTVVRVERQTESVWAEFDRTAAVVRGHRGLPDDPDGRTAVVHPRVPRDSGPIRLRLPVSAPVVPVSRDDAGWCVGARTIEPTPASLVLA
jgi:hypothetical protein